MKNDRILSWRRVGTHCGQLLLAVLLVMGGAGCDREGPAEETGEEIGEALDEAADEIEEAADEAKAEMN